MGNNIWITLGMVVLLFAVFYFFGIRPQKKQEKEAADMRNALTVGDEITTIGGIIGKIVSIKEETMIIETGRDHTRDPASQECRSHGGCARRRRTGLISGSPSYSLLQVKCLEETFYVK